MAQEITLKQVCVQCGGTGIYGAATPPHTGGPFTCQWQDCNGTGYMTFGKFIIDPGTNELDAKLDDIYDKIEDILDKL